MTTTLAVIPAEKRVSPRLIALIFAGVFVALAIGYYFVVQPVYVDAFTGVRPADTSALTAQLDAKGIPYRLADGGSTIAVPATKADAARVAIAGSDVPLHGGVGLELFSKSDMGLTDFAQKINYQRALQGELERTIAMIEGIETARVHLALPERSIFRAERTPPKAAVELLTKPGVVLDGGRIAGIQRLVANAVADLSPSDVVILDALGRALTGREDAAATVDPQGEQQQALQHYYRARVRSAIDIAIPEVQSDVHILVLSRDGMPSAAPAGATAHRDFGLRVTISSAAALTAAQQSQAEAAARQAIGFDAGLGDAIGFGVGIPDVDAPPAAATVSTAPTAIPNAGASTANRSSDASWILAIGILAIVIALVSVMQWLGRTAPVPGAREDLVARLRAALADGA